MLAVLRLAMGWLMFYAGWSKLTAPEGWSAKGYLLTSTGPFKDFFIGLAGNPTIDWLNMWGLTLIGLALIFGVVVRFASFWGALLMLLYYFAHFEQNIVQGWLDYHVFYTLTFIFFMFVGAGYVFGLDRYVEKWKLMLNYPWLKKIFLG